MSFPPPSGPSQSLPSPLAPPLESPPPDQNHFGRERTSNLYLIAFLAILFLLLFISGFIVLRSYVLRRRYRRRLEEALGPGQFLAPRAQGSKIKRLGTLPKIIDAWLTEGGDKWDQMMPISAQPVFVKRKIRVVKQDPPDQATNVPDAAPPTRMMNLFARFRRSPLPNSNIINEKHPSPPTQTNYRIRVEMLQLAVIIAMPSPNKSRSKNYILENTEPDPDDEESLPNIVFGVTRVSYRQPKSELTPSPTVTPLQST